MEKDPRVSTTSGRPSSRASTHRGTASTSTNRPSSALSSHASSSSTVVPKTPKPRRGTLLADRDLQKIADTIKTASKSTAAGHRSQKQHASTSLLAEAPRPAPAGSFRRESAFRQAPLNSRLPPVSPHRVAVDAKTSSRRNVAEDSFDDKPNTEASFEDEASFEEVEEARTRIRKREGLEKESLQGLSEDVQEALMVEDLLFVLMGVEGNYLEYESSYNPEDEYERLQGARFVIDPSVDPVMASVIKRLLPLATYYTAIQAFVEQYSQLEHGVINHALCAAIKNMLREYLVLLATLEGHFLTNPNFTLQRLMFNLHPTLTTLSIIHSLTSDLVALSLSTSDEDSESDSDASEGGEAMRAVINEMKAAEAGAKTNGVSSGWQGGVAKGGEVLYVLSDKLEKTSGNPTAVDVYSELMLRASQPYLEILLAWISTGHLADPWEEFIVRETKGIDKGSLEMDYTDEYWEKRYTLRDRGARRSAGGRNAESPRMRGLAGGAVVPAFLEPWKKKILLAGKYLNVIRECGIEIKVPAGEGRSDAGVLIALNEEGFLKRINEAYTYANQTLLKLLMEEQHLVSRLKSVKQYFFMDHGDSFTHFFDLAQNELSKRPKAVSITRLQALLELALRHPGSTTSNDPVTEDLKAQLGDTTLTEWLTSVVLIDGNFVGRDEGLTSKAGSRNGSQPSASGRKTNPTIGWDYFTLDYSVKFPISLVISRKCMLSYQLIFRHLLQLKRLERGLTDTWREHVMTDEWRQRSPYPKVENYKARLFLLRAKMYAFVQQMYSFTVDGVLEVNWRALQVKLEKVQTVDQLVADHSDFLDTCLKGCLLTTEQIIQVQSKILQCCTTFALYTSEFSKMIRIYHRDGERPGVESAQDPWTTLDKFEENFNYHFNTNLERINFFASGENSALLPLVVRLKNLALNSQEVDR